MTLDRERSSSWIRRFEDLVCCGYHVIVAGNTADRHLIVNDGQDGWEGTKDVCVAICRDLGYELLVQYDLGGGLQLVDEAMRPFYDEATSVQGSTAAAGTPPPPTTPDPAPDRPTEGGSPPPLNRPNTPRPAGPLVRHRSEAVREIGTLLQQDQVSTVVVIECADRLFSEHPGDEELKDQVVLWKAMCDAAFVAPERPMENWKNVLLMIATGPVSGMPVYLYRDNPHLTVLELSRPDRVERLGFFDERIDRFVGGSALGGEERQQTVARLADITDDLTAEDLGKLPRLSAFRSVSVADDPKRLVDQLRYGERRDPWQDLDAARVRGAEDEIGERVMGQEKAVRVVARSLKHARVGLTCDVNARGPKDVLLFAGPTGTGKTETAKAMAELLFGDSGSMTRLDMSEYQQEHSAERLAGAPPGYTGFEQGGQLTNAVMARPYQLILLDEVEKAHRCIWDKLLQVLEDGRMTDGRGQTAYFENTVMVFTTNLGASGLIDTFGEQLHRGDPPPYEEVEHFIRDEIRRYFTSTQRGGIGRPEILGRISDERIVVFDVLRPDVIKRIGRKFLDALALSGHRYGHTITFDDSIGEYLASAMNEPHNLMMGGRRIKMLIRNTIENPMTEWIANQTMSGGLTIQVAAAPDGRHLLMNGQQVAI